MIDRKARREMVAATRKFLNEEITAFEFDDALGEIASRTEDLTVRAVRNELWCFYDDLKNHKVVLSKPQWDYIYRLMLVLEVDAEADIEIHKEHEWSLHHPVAACALALYGVFACYVGWGTQLVVLSLPFGARSLLLALWRHMETSKPDALALALTPFSSMSQLRVARRHAPDFLKRRYPAHLADRRIRHPLFEMSTGFPSYLAIGLAWLMFAPIPLFFQCFPETNSRLAIKTV